MSKKLNIKRNMKKHLRWASGQILSTFLPEDFDTWTKRKLDNFLEKHTSELVEYWPAESIWEQIEDLAHSVKTNYKS